MPRTGSLLEPTVPAIMRQRLCMLRLLQCLTSIRNSIERLSTVGLCKTKIIGAACTRHALPCSPPGRLRMRCFQEREPFCSRPGLQTWVRSNLSLLVASRSPPFQGESRTWRMCMALLLPGRPCTRRADSSVDGCRHHYCAHLLASSLCVMP